MLDLRRFTDTFGIGPKRTPLRDGWEAAFERARPTIISEADRRTRAISQASKVEANLYRLTTTQIATLRGLLEQARLETIEVLSRATKDWQIKDRQAVLAQLDQAMRRLDSQGTLSLQQAQQTAWDAGAEAVISGTTLSALPRLDPGVISTAMQTTPALITNISREIETKIATMLRIASLGQTSPLDLMREMGTVAGKGVWASAFARGEAIYRTEVGRMFNTATFSRIEQLQASDPGWEKEWHSVHDARTRWSHVRADGQRVGANEMFDIGGYRAKYPHDPALPARESVHCRCIVIAVRPEWAKPEPPFEPARGSNIFDALGMDGEALDGALRALAYGLPEKEAVRNVAERMGFNGKPQTFTRAEIEAFVAAGETQWWRGVYSRHETAAEYAEALRSGNYHVGYGIFGPGIYTATGEARAFTPFRANDVSIAQAIDVAREFAGKGGTVSMGSIRADASLISSASLGKAWANFLKAAESYGDAIVGSLRVLGQNDSMKALLMGYDGLIVPNSSISNLLTGDQVVVLNRTILRVDGDTVISMDDIYETMQRTGGAWSDYRVSFEDAMAYPIPKP